MAGLGEGLLDDRVKVCDGALEHEHPAVLRRRQHLHSGFMLLLHSGAVLVLLLLHGWAVLLHSWAVLVIVNMVCVVTLRVRDLGDSSMNTHPSPVAASTCEYGTYKTVNAILWPWLSGKSP